MNVNFDAFDNYPRLENAGALGEVVNKRLSDLWVNTGTTDFPPMNEMIIEVLVEDYNKRHEFAPKQEVIK